MMVGQQQRQVLRIRRAQERDRAGTEVLHPVQARCMAVGERRDDDVRPAGQRLLRHLGGIADDEIGTVARGEQRVSPRTHPDQPRPMLPDEPPQPRQISHMVIARGDDGTCRSARSTCTSGTPTPSRSIPRSRRMNSIVLAANASNWWANPDLASTSASATEFRGLCDTLGEHLLPRVEHPVVQAHPDAVLDGVQHLGTDCVDQRDPGVDEDLRAQVGEAPGDRGGCVDDRHHVRGDQRVGGRPVQIELVEHRDVAGPQPPQQRAGVPVDPCDATDSGQLGPGAMQQSGELHARTMTARATSARQGTPKLTGA